MTTAVSGLIKIGSTSNEQYKERMRKLEGNGYSNVVGLKKNFAIEVNDYKVKEISVGQSLGFFIILGEENENNEHFYRFICTVSPDFRRLQ